MKKYVIGISLAVALLAGCSEKQEPTALQQLPLDLEAGKAIAQQHCVSCHSMDGQGKKDNIPNLAAQVETYLLKTFQTYNHGKRTDSSGDAMEISGELSPAQLRNVLGYFASLPPLAKSSTTSARYSYYDRGESLSKPCTRCHSADGNPTAPGMPRLAGQHPQYLLEATKAYQDGTRIMPTMHEKLTSLSQADMENIALYFALQPPKPAPSTATNAYDGKQLTYDCTECHGSKGSSQDASIPNLAGQDVYYLNEKIKAYRDKARKHGQMHKIVSELNDSEIEKIAVFFAAESPKPMSFTQPEPIYALAKQCDRCHSLDGANPDALAPKLEGQNRTYLINALTLYRDGDRGSSTMHRMSATYSDATIEGIATYYAAQAAR